MNFGFHPYSKAEQLHQTEKEAPVYKPRHYNRRKKQSKKVDHQGVKIPSRAKRAEFSRKDKEIIMEMWGDCCQMCGNPYVEFHHRKYRSQLGRNNPRNGSPLCNSCHTDIHKNQDAAQFLRDEAKTRFGEDYFKDKYDLWKENKIERPTDELFERYFASEVDRLEASKENMD